MVLYWGKYTGPGEFLQRNIVLACFLVLKTFSYWFLVPFPNEYLGSVSFS